MPKRNLASRTEPAHGFLYKPEQLTKPHPAIDAAPILSGMASYLKNPFNGKQEEAFARSFENRLTLLWGPPGTGKTSVLAAIVLGWLEHAWSQGVKICIGVGSSNYNAIDNVLTEVADLLERRQARRGPHPDTKLLRVRSRSAAAPEDGRLTDVERRLGGDYGLAKELGSPSASYVVGGTWMQLGKLAEAASSSPIAQWFDLLLIDEASQVSVASAAAYYLLLKPSAHVVLAGDHKQLGPIYPFHMKDSNSRLFDCIFTYMQETGGVVPVALDRNYRTNDEIAGWPRVRFYDRGYEAAMLKRRLDIVVPNYNNHPPEGWPAQLPWTSEYLRLLNPEWPVVVVTYRADRYTLSNPFEAQMVSAIAYLYRRILYESGKCPTDSEFWSRRLGIVTPHRAQMSCIRNFLVGAAGLPLSPAPFVDTVDRFQGQERDVMIASYAVADRDFVANEEEFILDPRRFNVTLTRSIGKFILFVSDAVIQHLPSDARVAREAAHLQLFVESYCDAPIESIYLPFIDNGTTHQMRCKLRVKDGKRVS